MAIDTEVAVSLYIYMSLHLWEGHKLFLVQKQNPLASALALTCVSIGIGVKALAWYFLSAKNLVNQWLDSYQIYIDI